MAHEYCELMLVKSEHRARNSSPGNVTIVFEALYVSANVFCLDSLHSYNNIYLPVSQICLMIR